MRIVPNPLPQGRCAGIDVEIQDPDKFRVTTLSNGAPIDRRRFSYQIADTTGLFWQGNDPSQALLCAKSGAPAHATAIHVTLPDGLTGDVQLTTLSPGTTAPPVVYPSQAPLRPAGVLPTYTMASGAASALPTAAAPAPVWSSTSSTASGAAVAPLGLAAPNGATTSPTRWTGQLVIDGQTMPASLISGGSVVSTVISNTSGAGQKHVGNITMDPLVIGVSPSGQVASLITSAWSGQQATHNGQIYANPEGSLTQSVGGKVQFLSALVVSTRIPTLYAKSPDKGDLLLLTLSSEQLRGGATSPTAASTSVGTISGFRFEMSGVEGGAVQRIESFAVETPLTADVVGVHEIARTPTLPPVWPNIVLTITEAQAPGWLAWYNDWMYAGNHLNTNEKTFTLDLLSTRGNAVVMTIVAHGVGLVSMKEGEVVGGKTTMQAELFVTSMEVKGVK